MTGFASALLVRRGTPEWDAVLRATGILALAAIYPALRWPDVAVLAGFVCLTVFVSGPISMVLPAAFEPMLMVAGRLYHPLLVTLLAVAGNLYMDYVNYHLYGAVMRHPRLEPARNSWVVRKTLALFQRSPFFAVWLCAWSPIPYGSCRCSPRCRSIRCGNTCSPLSSGARPASGSSRRSAF